MNTYVFRRIPGGRREQLWAGDMDSAPRPDEFLSVNPDDASYIVDHIEWNCSKKWAELMVYVK